MDDSWEGWTELRRCRVRGEAERYALVLVAMGIGCQLIGRRDSVALLVPSADAARADRQLGLYIRENWRPVAPPLPTRELSQGVNGVLAYATLLIALDVLSGRAALGLDWYGAGMARAGLIVGGEWWRTVTALGLHGDIGHLVGNIVAGGLFGLLLTQVLGTGLAWLAILLSGAAGNLLAALIHQVPHASLGASTGVFAALGLLAALAWRRRASRQMRGLRRWLPLAAGAMVLGYLGVGGERTDVVAHVTGFVAGGLFGAGIAWAGARVQQGRRAQLAYGASAGAILAAAWLVALA